MKGIIIIDNPFVPSEITDKMKTSFILWERYWKLFGSNYFPKSD